MHLCNCTFGIIHFFVEDVCSSTVDVDYFVSLAALGESWRELTYGVHGHPEIFDGAVFAENLANMVFFDIPGQCLYHDLLDVSCVQAKAEDSGGA